MALEPNRWTHKTQEALTRAVESAKAESNPEVTPDHLLLALLGQEDRIVLPILQRVGVAPLSLRNATTDALEQLPKAYGSEARLSRELNPVIQGAHPARADLHYESPSTEHILLALATSVRVVEEATLPARPEGGGH